MVRIEIVSDLTFGRSVLLAISIVFSQMQIADNVINIHLCRSFWTYLTICILLPALSKIKVFRIIMEEWLSVLASFQHIKKAKNITKVRNCTDITICLFVLFIFFSFCLFVFLSFCLSVFLSSRLFVFLIKCLKGLKSQKSLFVSKFKSGSDSLTHPKG